MKRWKTSALFLVMLPLAARAHFVFVVPQGGGLTAQVFLSETLSPDPAIDPAMIKDAELLARDTAGHDNAVALQAGKDSEIAKIPAGTRIIHGTADLGVTSREADHPYVLIYYPKTIIGDAFDPAAVLSRGKVSGPPVEIVPVGKVGELKLELLVDGLPKGGAEITVLLPDGRSKKSTTDEKGLTENFAMTGRYGAWARSWETIAGTRGGEKYTEIRRYAVVVFDAGKAAGTPAAATKPAITAVPFAEMPYAASSFGAIVSGDWLYLYGGHVATVHAYSTDAVSGKFSRLNLADGKADGIAGGKTWQPLPSGPAMQGMNLAAWDGRIYRIGGMVPRNKPGDPEEIWSSDECAVFDPVAGTWTDLPKLPAARSSHDVIVAGNTLYVVGGWTLSGSSDGVFAQTMLAMDLSKTPPAWREIAQPFTRRALCAAAPGGKIYALGGFDENTEAVHAVSVFDPAAGAWTSGPDLPGGEQNGFGPAACTVDGPLYVSVADGTLYRLSADGRSWESAGSATPRLVHRIAPDGGRILVIGGAEGGKNSDLIEAVDVVGKAGK